MVWRSLKNRSTRLGSLSLPNMFRILKDHISTLQHNVKVDTFSVKDLEYIQVQKLSDVEMSQSLTREVKAFRNGYQRNYHHNFVWFLEVSP